MTMSNGDMFGHVEIRMLSFWQPFGTLMFYGKVETRSWATSYRGLVLFVSTEKPWQQQPPGKRGKIIMDNSMRHSVETCIDFENEQEIDTSELNGWAIGLGVLVECRKVKLTDKTFFKHHIGLYAHIYDDVRRIKPFEIKGKQGFPRINESVKQKIIFLE